jgi:hypothetical protein
MRAKNHTRLTPRERLSRGLASTAVGPVDVTRGLVGLGVHSAQAGASSLRRRYHEGRLAHDLHSAQEALVQELAAAQDVVTGLPEALQQARRAQRHGKRPLLIGGVAVAVLAAGAVAFSIVRRSARPEPSALPPSVEVDPPL